jgi:hypothetical protein
LTYEDYIVRSSVLQCAQASAAAKAVGAGDSAAVHLDAQDLQGRNVQTAGLSLPRVVFTLFDMSCVRVF